MKIRRILRGAGASMLVAVGLCFSGSVLADKTVLPDQPEAKSPATASVQSDVNREAATRTEEKRRELMKEAISAVDETRNALQALEEDRTGDALEALAVVTGKLELILARDPALALAPVDVDVRVFDLLANMETIQETTKVVQDLVKQGEFQRARPIIDHLASEIQYVTVNVPLATYPDAIKAVVPLIDAGQTERAMVELQAALNTLVVTTDIIPLPVVRADALLALAEELSEKVDRSEEDENTLSDAINAAEKELKIAELLGYGDKKAYEPMYEQVRSIKKNTAGGGSGTGWFDKLKQQVADLV